jgi:hypothetical protein
MDRLTPVYSSSISRTLAWNRELARFGRGVSDGLQRDRRLIALQPCTREHQPFRLSCYAASKDQTLQVAAFRAAASVEYSPERPEQQDDGHNRAIGKSVVRLRDSAA